MKKLLKHIPAWCIGLAALIYNAHAIIPHDHHFADAASGMDTGCRTTENNNGDEDNAGRRTDGGRHLPFHHCHAFNYLVSEEADRRLLADGHGGVDCQAGRLAEILPAVPITAAIARIPDQKEAAFIAIFVTPARLRAPPALA